MFTLYTRREANRVEAFVAAMHRSAHCADACCAPYNPPTVEFPAIIATADPGPEPAVLETTATRALVLLVGMLVVLASFLGAGLMSVSAPHPAAPAHELVDLTSDTTADRAAEQATR